MQFKQANMGQTEYQIMQTVIFDASKEYELQQKSLKGNKLKEYTKNFAMKKKKVGFYKNSYLNLD